MEEAEDARTGDGFLATLRATPRFVSHCDMGRRKLVSLWQGTKQPPPNKNINKGTKTLPPPAHIPLHCFPVGGRHPASATAKAASQSSSIGGGGRGTSEGAKRRGAVGLSHRPIFSLAVLGLPGLMVLW